MHDPHDTERFRSFVSELLCWSFLLWAPYEFDKNLLAHFVSWICRLECFDGVVPLGLQAPHVA
jgi:hypothetical protein